MTKPIEQAEAEEKAYRVETYKFENLVEWFADPRVAVDRSTERVLHKTNALAVYFKDYLSECNVATMVLENTYVDLDFLEDFAGYYVHCFSELPKYAKRIHFFSCPFLEDDFAKALRGENSALLAQLSNPDHYIGFIVVKPLPKTFIGRTCLRAYPEIDKKHPTRKRQYPIQKTYNANLFGIKLSVSSIAFQEQDEAVSACATSALWSMFHASQKMFENPIPSPHAITSTASERIPDWQFSHPDTRRFPSGLTNSQMAIVIREAGLEAYLIGFRAPADRERLVAAEPGAGELNVKNSLNTALYAYISGEIPVVVTGRLVEPIEKEATNAFEKAIAEVSQVKERVLGDHAMTLLGFGMEWGPAPEAIRSGNSETVFRSMRMDRIYAHDDQIGPFARMKWIDDTSLETSWRHLRKRKILFRPQCAFIPLMSQIRIPYETVHEAIVELNELIRSWVVRMNGCQVEWEIRLLTVNKFKTELMADQDLNKLQRIDLLTQHLPKYLWVATGWIEKEKRWKKYIDFAVDATALDQEGGLRAIVGYDPFLIAAFTKGVKAVKPDVDQRPLTRKIIQYFLDLDAGASSSAP
jgi:hypothetical protein